MNSKKLHILFLCGWYPSRVLPTNGDFIQRHAEAVALKHKVSVIHLITDKNCTKNIEITKNKTANLTTFIGYIKPQKNKIVKLKLFWKAYTQILKEMGGFDIIHLHEIYPFGILARLTAKKYKVPYMISEHHTFYLQTSKLKGGFLKNTIAKNIVKNAAVICPVSNYMAKNMQNSGYKGNYVTVPNVVDTTLFIPKKKNTLTLKLIHVSSLKDNHKNIKGMLRVAKQLDKNLDYFEWQFIGNNGLEYQDFIKNLNIKNGCISFLNHITQQELVSHLQEASICISFSNYETFGIVIPEAIACGTPVIATETGIAFELKKVDFCKVIPVKNEELLCNEILNYTSNFANLNPYKMHNFVEQQFCKEVIANKFSLLYHKFIKN